MRPCRVSVFLAIFVAGVAAAMGCSPTGPRRTVVFATMSDVLLTDGRAEPDVPAGEAPPIYAPDALERLRRTVAELNASDDVEFVIVLGNLLANPRYRALDRARTVLSELEKPYFVVLGPEGINTDDRPEAGDSEQPAAVESDEMLVGRSLLTWTFRGHGFDGPQEYWAQNIDGGLTLVALYTAGPGIGRPGHVDARQLRWLDETLSAHNDRAVIVLAYHGLVQHHPYDATQAWRRHLVDNRREVLDVLDGHDNVRAVLSASHRFAAGKVVGEVVHISSPGLSVWPLAYDLLKVEPLRIERSYMPVGTDSELRAAFDRLADQPDIRELLGTGERAESQVLQIFGGRKAEAWNLRAIRQ